MKKRKHTMWILGVTGNIGSGKSTVCSYFEKLGIPVLHADDIAKEVSVKDEDVRRQIVALIGADAFDKDGNLNRAFIAEKIFSNSALRKQYEKILHPKVQDEIEKRISELSNQQSPFVVVEAALLYEAGWNRSCDAVLVVDADEEIAVKRVCSRDRANPEDVRSRLRAQWKSSSKISRADYVIRNNGSLEELERNVEFLYHLFITMKERK